MGKSGLGVKVVDEPVAEVHARLKHFKVYFITEKQRGKRVIETDYLPNV